MAGELTLKEFELFEQHFEGFQEQYVLIGGSATFLHMNDAALPFRATKDLDLVLCVEALSQKFVDQFWKFVIEAGYQTINKSTGKACFYRFTEPSKIGYPYMIEILSEKADIIGERSPGTIVPMAVADELVSLSAILLNKEYYDFIMKNKVILKGITIADHRVLIPLKARAYLDLRQRRDMGETINTRDIKKHKNDIYRLAQLLTDEPLEELPDLIKKDVSGFVSSIEDSDDLLRQIKVLNSSIEAIKEKLLSIYCD